MTPETFELICQEIESVPHGLHRICGDFKTSTREFYNLINRALDSGDETYQLRYARAKERQTEALHDHKREILAEMPPMTQSGGMDSAFVAWQNNRAKDIQWDLGKLRPKKYGDKLQQEISGQDGSPITVVLNMPAKKPVEIEE